MDQVNEKSTFIGTESCGAEFGRTDAGARGACLVWARSGVTISIPGIRTVKQVAENAEAMKFRSGRFINHWNMSINLLDQKNARELIEPAQIGRVGDGARFQFTIQVPDVDRICDELEARGVKLLNGPITRPRGRCTACLADPDGHVWEIAQLL